MKVLRTLSALALFGTLVVPGALAQGNGNGNGNGNGRARKAKVKAANDQRDYREEEMRFRGMDDDKDGVITRAEWRGNDQSFREQDANEDGVLSGNVVRARAITPATPDRTRNQEIAARFDRVDQNRDGRLSRDEWTGTAERFDRLDRNRDRFITRDEFLTLVPDRAAPPPPAPITTTRVYQAGYDKGLAEGRQAGREDKTINGGRWDLEGQRELEQADSGWRPELGVRSDYQSGYRAGFRVGYREGFGPR
jgi:Ca2+-binding EF-hand superfamily protein